MAVPDAPRRRRAGSLALAALIACTAAQAQTTAQTSPHTAQVQRCMALSQHEPNTALELAGELLRTPALPTAIQVQALGCLALAQQVNGQGEAAEATVERLLAAADDGDIPAALRMNARLQAAGVLLSTAQQERALALMDEVLDESQRRGEAATTLNALLSIAGARASQLDDPAGALPYYEQAIALSDGLDRGPAMQDAVLHYNHAYTLLTLERYPEAEAGFERALRIARTLPGQQGFIDRIGSHRGEILRATGHLAEARTLLDGARDAQERSGDTHGLTVTLQRLARLALDQGNAAAALAPAERALELAEAGRFALETRDGLELLAAIHAARGVPAEAARFTRRIQAMERERDRAAALDKLARLQAQIQRETAPGGATSEELGRARLLRNSALAALLAVLAIGGTMLWRMRRRQQALRVLGGTDPLTGLPNRREAEARIAALVAAHPGGSERRCVLLLAGVDGLEAINRRHGHAAGDQAVVHVARVLAEAGDVDDLLARWESGKFLVVRADSAREAAFALAEHLRLTVARAPFVLADGTPLEVSVSIGLAAHPFFPRGEAGDGAEAWQQSLRLADRALRAAVQSGRNAWAGLWGLAEGVQADLGEVHESPAAALARGWIAAGGSRPLSWASLRDPDGVGPTVPVAAANENDGPDPSRQRDRAP